MSLVEAAAEADELAQSGAERELAMLRQQWDDELEVAARSADYRERAVAYRAIGQFRFRQKLELLRRGLEDESPAARGSALLSVQLLSKDSPGVVNAIRPAPPRDRDDRRESGGAPAGGHVPATRIAATGDDRPAERASRGRRAGAGAAQCRADDGG